IVAPQRFDEMSLAARPTKLSHKLLESKDGLLCNGFMTAWRRLRAHQAARSLQEGTHPLTLRMFMSIVRADRDRSDRCLALFIEPTNIPVFRYATVIKAPTMMRNSKDICAAFV